MYDYDDAASISGQWTETLSTKEAYNLNQFPHKNDNRHARIKRKLSMWTPRIHKEAINPLISF